MCPKLIAARKRQLQNENEMQVWTQRMTDSANREMAELRKEMNKKLEKMMKEVKNSRRMQSVSNIKITNKLHQG